MFLQQAIVIKKVMCPDHCEMFFYFLKWFFLYSTNLFDVQGDFYIVFLHIVSFFPFSFSGIFWYFSPFTCLFCNLFFILFLPLCARFSYTLILFLILFNKTPLGEQNTQVTTSFSDRCNIQFLICLAFPTIFET